MQSARTRRMLSRWFPFALAPLLALLAVAVLAVPALAATVYNTSMPFNEGFFNPCNGESVLVSGTEHDLLSITLDNNGGFHGDMQANFPSVSGVGDQGNTYTVTGAFHDNVNGQVGHEETITETFNVTSQGSAPNFDLHELFHITFNANGTVTSFHDTYTTTCTG